MKVSKLLKGVPLFHVRCTQATVRMPLNIPYVVILDYDRFLYLHAIDSPQNECRFAKAISYVILYS